MKEQNENYMTCPNCQYHNDVSDIFCSQCGQKTRLSLLSVWVMMSEFIANIINYDSKIFTTVRGLFVSGYLTNQYLANKRVAYLAPMRLFIFLMFVFFAVLSFQNYDQFLMNTNDDFEVNKNDNDGVLFNKDTNDFNLLEQNFVSLRYERLIRQLNNELHEQKQQQQDKLDQINKQAKQSSQPNAQQELLNKIDEFDEAINSLQNIKSRIDLKKDKSVNITLFFDHQYEFNIHDLNNLSPEKLIEKYQINHWLEKIMVKQYLKLNKDHRAFSRFIFQNLTWVFIMEILLMSLFFKIFYFRSKRKYVEFFVFHLNIRSFLFLIGSGVLLIPYPLNDWISTLLFCTIIAYLLLSMKRVFKQSWLLTIIKFLTLSMIEFMVFLLSFIVVVISSSFIY